MKRLIDKLCACWCILSSREYVIFTCNKFTSAKNSKCWVSAGVDEKLPNYNTFLDATKEYIDTLKNEQGKIWNLF